MILFILSSRTVTGNRAAGIWGWGSKTTRERGNFGNEGHVRHLDRGN